MSRHRGWVVRDRGCRIKYIQTDFNMVRPARPWGPAWHVSDAIRVQNALGVHYGWGFSPAINLQAGLEEQPPCDGARGDTGGAEPLNILVARGCDIRHVLKTISERDRFPRRPLHVRSLRRNVGQAGTFTELAHPHRSFICSTSQRRWWPGTCYCLPSQRTGRCRCVCGRTRG